MWKRLITYIDGIAGSVEELVTKYRTQTKTSKPSLVFKGTWSGTNTIVSTGSDAEQSIYADIDVNDELTIVDGYGRGYTVHVTANDESGGTYTLTLDESVGTDSQSVYFRADNFTKIATVSSTREEDSCVQHIIDQKGAWTQIKGELRGFEPEISHLDLSNSADKRSV